MRMTCAAVAGSLACGAAWGQCQNEWSDAFVPAFMLGGDAASATLYDGGAGARLVVSGLRRRGDAAAGLQVWDGMSWTTLSDAQFELTDVQLVGAHNGGARPRLFAVVGEFGGATEVAVFENGDWSGTSFPGGSGLQIAGGLAPDPLTDDVYMFGLFRNEGEWTKVYKWDGTSWVALDRDANGSGATSLAWFDHGSGPALYAGVRTQIDGVPARGLARWDGQSWSEVPGCPVSWPTIAAHDDGSGPAIWALDSGAMSLAKWDGEAWTLHELESRPVFYSWRLQSATLNGAPALVWLDQLADSAQVWRWDGVDGELVTEVSDGYANDLIGDGSGLFGGGLIAAGTFLRAGDVRAASVAAFDGSGWVPLGTEDLGNGAPRARALLVPREGAPPALADRLYVAGSQFAGGSGVRTLATWDGHEWIRIAPADFTEFSARAMAMGDIGLGEELFVGGSVQGVEQGNTVAAWNGAAWRALPPFGFDGSVRAVEVGDLGHGPEVFVGGTFPGYAAAFRDGTWSVLGSGLDDVVDAMCVFDDGSGTALYVGGPFTHAGGEQAMLVARWNGEQWSAVGDGLWGGRSPRVEALEALDLGDGPAIYAGAWLGAGRVFKWDGWTWSPLGDGLSTNIVSLATVDLGEGPRLLAATTGGTAYILEGQSWAHFAEADDRVDAIASVPFDHGAVYLAGEFTEVDGVPSHGIARWGCACVADFNNDGGVDSRDFIAYLNAWAAGDASADTDGNGLVDSRDFIAFLNAWSAGC